MVSHFLFVIQIPLTQHGEFHIGDEYSACRSAVGEDFPVDDDDIDALAGEMRKILPPK